jgi:two-component system chemotaxis response regulator CheY
MSKKVALVGHCGPDSAYLRIAVSGASKGASVIALHDDSSLQQAMQDGLDLILVNRQLDYGFTADEGVELVKQLREKHPELKMMLISNYPEAQEEAVAAGALPGFGKREIGSPKVKEMLRAALAEEDKVKS